MWLVRRRFVFVVLLIPCLISAARAETIRVFAAVSLTEAVAEVGKAFQEATGNEVRFSFAGSSILARQIAQGAPADVYFSANPAWMDYLVKEDMIAAGTRRDVLGNRLVVISPVGDSFSFRIEKGAPFGNSFEGRLAMADPDHVPAGHYARQALTWLGWWREVEDRLATSQNVRVALAYVEREACQIGIVYATDAQASKKVKVAGEFPEEASDSIVYPMAVIRNRQRSEVNRFVKFVGSEVASSLFKKHGFIVLPVDVLTEE